MKNEIPRQDRPVDVLIITATEVELDAVLSVIDPMDDSWKQFNAYSGCKFYFRKFRGEKTAILRIAVARSRFMETESAAATAATLISYLEPRCLAMCGVCAGRPGETQLGDLIVAERVYL